MLSFQELGRLPSPTPNLSLLHTQLLSFLLTELFLLIVILGGFNTKI